MPRGKRSVPRQSATIYTTNNIVKTNVPSNTQTYVPIGDLPLYLVGTNTDGPAYRATITVVTYAAGVQSLVYRADNIPNGRKVDLRRFMPLPVTKGGAPGALGEWALHVVISNGDGYIVSINS